jgi:hypothetical protein
MNKFELITLFGGMFTFVCYTLFMKNKKFTKRMYSMCVCISSVCYLIGAIGITNRGTIIMEILWLATGIYGVIKNKD